MKKSLLVSLPVAAFVAGMAVVPSVFAAGGPSSDNCSPADATAFKSDIEADCPTITLNGDISLTTFETINKTLTINLNGKTITNTEGKTALYVNDGNLTLTGSGTVTSKSADNAPVYVKGTLNVQGNVKIENTDNGMAVIGNVGEINISENADIVSQGTGISIDGEGSKLKINGGTVNATGDALTVFGTNPEVAISGGTINSANGFALSGNGSKTTNSAITISGNASLTSQSTAAIYNPQSGTLNMSGGTVTGKAGIVARAGTIDITGGTINASGTGEEQIGDLTDPKVPLGVAVYVNNVSGGYRKDAAVSIANATINATNENPVLAYKAENPGDEIKVLAGTTFTGTKPANVYLAEGVEIDDEGKAIIPESATSTEDTTNPNTADSIALYITIAAIALLGLGATALIAKKANR